MGYIWKDQLALDDSYGDRPNDREWSWVNVAHIFTK